MCVTTAAAWQKHRATVGTHQPPHAYSRYPLIDSSRGLFMLRNLIAASFVAALSTSPLAFAQNAPPGAPEQARPQGAGEHQQACAERYAHTVARLAYLEARLELTADQHPLWDRWRDAVISGVDQQRALCRQSPFRSGGHPTIVERQAYFAQITAARAQALQRAQPPLEALYQVLTPEQREVLDRPMSGHRRHHDRDDWPHGRRHESD
jgi:hypothetical protein